MDVVVIGFFFFSFFYSLLLCSCAPLIGLSAPGIDKGWPWLIHWTSAGRKLCLDIPSDSLQDNAKPHGWVNQCLVVV